jgi:spore maturation protein CgeB
VRLLTVAPGPNFSVADVHDGWVAAFKELGLQVADVNLDRRLDFYAADPRLSPEDAIKFTNNSLHAVCYQYRPDVLFVTSCMYLTAGHLDTIRARGTRIVILFTESPYEDDIQLQRAEHCDVALLNDPTHLDAFRRVCPSSWYVPHAYRPDRHFPRQSAEADHKSDFCFVGTGFPSRVEFFEHVDWTGIDVALGGHWANLPAGSPLLKFLAHDPDECLPNEQTAQLYAGTKASANLYRREANRPELAAGWAMGPREVELAAMRKFFLRDPRPESDLVLGHTGLPTFAGPEDFGEQLRWWLEHDDEREAAAEKAQLAVVDRTFVNHAKLLMRVLGL